MMTKIEEFAKAASDENKEGLLNALDQVQIFNSQIRASVNYGYRTVSRVQLFKNLQNALGAAIAFDGRQSVVEDLRENASKPTERPTIHELEEKVHRALSEALKDFGISELSRYSEDDAEDTDDPPSEY